MQNFDLRIGSEFKWDQYPPTWTSVFLGSNDEIPRYKSFTNQLKAYSDDEIELISIIGGMRFLDLLSETNFHRVTLFDKNINEFTKFILILREFEDLNYESYDQFRNIDEQIRSEPEKFYLPARLNNFVRFKPKFDFHFNYNNKTSSLHTLLPPTEYPEYTWNPSKDQYNRVKKTLTNNLNNEIFLGLPEIDAEGRLVFVYLSGVHDLDWNFTESIRNASGVIPIGSHPFHTTFEGHFNRITQSNNSGNKRSGLVLEHIQKNIPILIKGLNHLAKGDLRPIFSHLSDQSKNSKLNNQIINPHIYWEDMVLRYAISPNLHIWPPENRHLANGDLDKEFDFGIGIREFLNETYSFDYKCCIFHIILGKNETQSRSQREQLFTRGLNKATKLGTNRIIVTEHNKSSDQFNKAKCTVSKQQLRSIINDAKPCHYEIVDQRDIPGMGIPNRNILMVIDKNRDN